eukprot:TRINITY_DN75314_c0_g1_i1.p2 TRINITY_DN75314_c0_g1~~TRINITY_DN75314_c0_g1_i1.p2  ORF type:complete len:104 (+),score=29.24 TRINITY_DN75314_c0_g1_i1:102-413(+)
MPALSKDGANMTALTLGLGVIAAVTLVKLLKKNHVNPGIKKDCDKCVNILALPDLEELKKADGKLVFCRCWRSKTFPYCDGAHNEHNKCTGDNVGPLIIKATK